MTYIKIFIFCLMLCVLGNIGCSDSSSGIGKNSSSCTDFGTGSGYKIKLCVTNSILPQGGQTTLIASVKDGQENPVNDSSRGVTFTSTQGATINADKTINLGVCSAIYTAPAAATQPSTVVDQIEASYQGAFAHISIQVYKQ